MPNKQLLAGAVLLATLGTGAAACTPSLAGSSGSGPAAGASSTPGAATMTGTGTMAGTGTVTGTGTGTGTATSGVGSQGIMTGPGAYQLSAMPAGTVSLSRDGHGHLQAQVNLFGLTPGSAHAVDIDGFGKNGSPAVEFPVLTASASGQADTTLTSTGRVRSLPPFSRFVIRLGSDGSALAAEPIAESDLFPGHLGRVTATFHAVTASTSGIVTGQPRGQATISYAAAAQTLTITVTASGLNPGPHAAHIHLGSCASQGPVKYMLPDFIADSQGDIDHQTRVVTGVPSVPGPGNWYLNLHMGGMSQILDSNGTPTLSFRPLLCTNVTSVAGATATPTPTMPASTPMPGMSTGTPMPGMTTSPPTATPSGEPTVAPTSGPTHF